MNDEASELAELLERAKGPEDIFGDATLDEIHTIWRKFAVILHPDRQSAPAAKAQAERAFVRGLRAEGGGRTAPSRHHGEDEAGLLPRDGGVRAG